MADINTGRAVRFENGGALKIGGSAATVLLIESGTLEFSVPGKEAIAIMDRGNLIDVLEGDERQITGAFNVKIGPDGIVGAADIRAVMAPAGSGGGKALIDIVVDIPDGEGAITGQRITFGSCYLPDGYSYKAGGPGQADTLTFRFADNENEPTYASY